VLDRNLVLVVADHHERRSRVAGQIGHHQRGLLLVHAVELRVQRREGVGPIGRDGAMELEKERHTFRVEVDGTGCPSLVVKDARGHHQPTHEIGAQQGRPQRHRRPVAVADEERRAAHHLLEERDGVPRHQLVGNRTPDVGRTTVAAAIGPEHSEVLGQAGQVRFEHPGVGAAGVQQHHRLTLSVLLVVRVHIAELGVTGHRRLLSWLPG
jgi:hypothetical protein